MPIFSDNQIESIKARLSASEVVSPYVNLTKKGDRYWGLCPFHTEKTPSFSVKDDSGFYKCFGCGKGGGIFDFIMEIEHVSFPESVKILAKKAGVELFNVSEDEKKVLNRKKDLQELYNRISESFHSVLLMKDYADNARNYLKKRKISDETIKKFKLGYAPNSKDFTYELLHKNGYSDDLLKESGLFSKDSTDFYPFFKNRLLFPIRTWQGNIVAFSGRDLSGEDKAKYKNSPETVLYSKRSILFGLFESLMQIKKREEVIVCEGNFDVISLHQAGLSYSVAPLGVAFTEEQVKLLKRWCNKIYLLFDSDEAGQNATKKAVILCQKNGMDSFVINFSSVKDASQLLQEQGPEALLEACSSSIPGFSYLVNSAKMKYNTGQPKTFTSVFKEVEPFLSATLSEIERQGYIKYLSESFEISEEQILNEYERKDQKSAFGLSQKIKMKEQLNFSFDLKAMLLIVNNRSYFDVFKKKIKIDYLTDADARKLYAVLETSEREGIEEIDLILQMIDDDNLKKTVIASLDNEVFKPDDINRTVQEVIKIIIKEKLVKKRNRIQAFISTSDTNHISEAQLDELLQTLQELDSEIMFLGKGVSSNK